MAKNDRLLICQYASFKVVSISENRFNDFKRKNDLRAWKTGLWVHHIFTMAYLLFDNNNNSNNINNK